MKDIFEIFNKILPMSELEVSQISPLLKIKTLQKDEFLLKQDQICDSIAFINHGSFRSFYNKSNGFSINLMLNSAHEFIGNLDSFITGRPSNIFIQATEKSELIYLPKNDLDKLYEHSLYWNKFGRLMTENIFIISKLRLESLLYNTPEERYLYLIAKHPEFINKYSLTDIASFIGITLQSLSRIRARI